MERKTKKLSTWRVVRQETQINVEAESAVIALAGALVFEKDAGAIKAFAPGHWITIEWIDRR